MLQTENPVPRTWIRELLKGRSFSLGSVQLTLVKEELSYEIDCLKKGSIFVANLRA